MSEEGDLRRENARLRLELESAKREVEVLRMALEDHSFRSSPSGTSSGQQRSPSSQDQLHLPPAGERGTTSTGEEEDAGRRAKKKKKVRVEMCENGPDFTACPYVYVSLKLAYLGWAYHGFARLKHLEETVEEKFFNAVKRSRLIPPQCDPVADLDYSRCGRTDKGVSASGQVISLKLRGASGGQPPLDYVNLINRHLPDDIRVLRCLEGASPEFNARFDSKGRHYKYFFVQDGSYDVEAMNAAAACFLGEHDFRNFCKRDENAQTYLRRIDACYIEDVSEVYDSESDEKMYALNVIGSAFLWHQVRCMASVLFSVGQGQLEEKDIRRYLNPAEQPRRPNYTMAKEEPLLLYRCMFDDLKEDQLALSALARKRLESHLQSLQRNLRIRLQLVKEIFLTSRGASESANQ
ncbi:tRNA pseudouridine synthase [Chloropicon primus]|uniref:tRNA pseudouridine synthase n=1 Tax=Chloropicon primus TaxID=1764295 RepID=A0A5B8MSR6_9CHLO|nr:tRNA pseudouridine synthase [Chloropicon primus]UPR02603.1 tRNA pseudouridine synthase [Chloropicon primus]|mmetsp:Transcript_6321/g.18764  ORF Transcript_6321/g.18764 Transcript_6321/m.18764 type:complete len:408 (-) Transcript_6321:1690-2913(-)|eukprot:QDZ23391.1 tRNA pseudouridine synthase [Chloropicon primus]